MSGAGGRPPAAAMVVETDSAPEIGVRNSQPHGIGRVVALGDLVCWNNLGRNVVFADRRCRPRAVFGQTLFPDEDEPSQYDLDIHAVVDLPGRGLVLVLNHLGCLRAFRRSDVVGPGPLVELEPATTTFFAADVERTVVAGTCLVGSRPRCEGAGGLVVSAPMGAGPLPERLGTGPAAEPFGEVTALGVVTGGELPLVAMGGVGRVALVPVDRGRVHPSRWQVDVDFRAAVVAWAGGLLWVAGCAPAPGVDDYDWESLHGGGFVALDPGDGHVVASGSLPDDVAWGTGAVPVVATGGGLAAVGRTGRVHLINPADPAHPEPGRTTAPLAAASLGLAHAGPVPGGVVFGFNRGGYRLHRYG